MTDEPQERYHEYIRRKLRELSEEERKASKEREKKNGK